MVIVLCLRSLFPGVDLQPAAWFTCLCDIFADDIFQARIMRKNSTRRYDPVFLPLFLLRILSLTNRLLSLSKRDISFCLRLTLSLDMASFSVRLAMRFSTPPQRLQIRTGMLFSTFSPFILPQYLPVLHFLLDCLACGHGVSAEQP